jgi:hypothetical protein
MVGAADPFQLFRILHEGLDPDPVAAYHRSGYAEKIVADRIAGTGSGIGRATVQRLAAEGACVVLADRDGAAVKQDVRDDILGGAAAGPARPLPVIAVGSHDTASAVAGVPAEGASFAYISCGTWSLAGVELGGPVLTEAGREAGFTNEAGVDGTVRFLRNVMGSGCCRSRSASGPPGARPWTWRRCSPRRPRSRRCWRWWTPTTPRSCRRGICPPGSPMRAAAQASPFPAPGPAWSGASWTAWRSLTGGRSRRLRAAARRHQDPSLPDAGTA